MISLESTKFIFASNFNNKIENNNSINSTDKSNDNNKSSYLIKNLNTLHENNFKNEFSNYNSYRLSDPINKMNELFSNNSNLPKKPDNILFSKAENSISMDRYLSYQVADKINNSFDIKIPELNTKNYIINKEYNKDYSQSFLNVHSNTYNKNLFLMKKRNNNLSQYSVCSKNTNSDSDILSNNKSYSVLKNTLNEYKDCNNSNKLNNLQLVENNSSIKKLTDELYMNEAATHKKMLISEDYFINNFYKYNQETKDKTFSTTAKKFDNINLNNSEADTSIKKNNCEESKNEKSQVLSLNASSSLKLKKKRLHINKEFQLVNLSDLPQFNKPYSSIPDKITISRMKYNELENVNDFTIYNDHGRLIFPGITNLCGLDIDNIVELSEKFISVYKIKPEIKPKIGEGLNKYVIIEVYNVFPTSSEKMQQFISVAIKKIDYINGTFISYDYVKGVLVYSKENFDS